MLLATLADLKTYLDLAAVAADAELTRLLTMASSMAENHMDRSVQPGVRTETRSGSGTDVLLLKDYPVTAITSLTVNGVAVAATDGTSAGYGFTDESLWLRSMIFYRDRRNVVVTYTAGWADTASVPADVQQAVVEIAAQAYREKQWIGVTSKSLAGETTAFLRAAMPDSAVVVLNRYRRMHACD